MNRVQVAARTLELIKQELKQPFQWWYLSFAGEEGFRGGVLVEERGPVMARTKMRTIGVESPGGEVLFIPVPREHLPPVEYRNRLLSKADVLAMWPDSKTIREHEEDYAKQAE